MSGVLSSVVVTRRNNINIYIIIYTILITYSGRDHGSEPGIGSHGKTVQREPTAVVNGRDFQVGGSDPQGIQA